MTTHHWYVSPFFGHRLALGMERSMISNQVRHLDRSSPTTVAIPKWHHSFAHVILILFDQFHRCARAASMLDVQPSRCGRKRCPHGAVHQAARHLPSLFQDFDLAVAINLSDKMDAALRHRQVLRHPLNLFLGQPSAAHKKRTRRETGLFCARHLSHRRTRFCPRSFARTDD